MSGKKWKNKMAFFHIQVTGILENKSLSFNLPSPALGDTEDKLSDNFQPCI